MPNDTLLITTALIGILAAGTQAVASPTTFTYTGSIQTFVAPTTGTYDITAIGAAGGTGFDGGGAGGLGAEIGGDVFLTLGDTLTIVVGGAGYGAPAYQAIASEGAGGGGGSFVFGPGNVAFVIGGGGGGGGGGASGKAGANANLGTAGTSGTGSGGAGGTAGQGGAGSYPPGTAAGGGGLLSAGGSGDEGAATGGAAAGGAGGTYLGGHPQGGFGGGGAGYVAGGGGGGYSGGGGGGVTVGSGGGGGGGSYLAPTFFDPIQVADVATADKNGLVTIDLLQPLVPTPEPSSLALLGAGLLAMIPRRRR